MVPQLLPASAAASASRTDVIVALDSSIVRRLRTMLKSANVEKEPLNSPLQQKQFLMKKLSSETATWHLTTMTLPMIPNAAMKKQDIGIEGYVTHVTYIQHVFDVVCYKLTQRTIDKLVSYYSTLHSDFVQAINGFVYCASTSELEHLRQNGDGRLQPASREKVTSILMRLIQQFFPCPSLTNHVIATPTFPAQMPKPPLHCISATDESNLLLSVNQRPANITMRWPSCIVESRLLASGCPLLEPGYSAVSSFITQGADIGTTYHQGSTSCMVVPSILPCQYPFQNMGNGEGPLFSSHPEQAPIMSSHPTSQVPGNQACSDRFLYTENWGSNEPFFYN